MLYFGFIDKKISSSDKDLPVWKSYNYAEKWPSDAKYGLRIHSEKIWADNTT